MSQELSVNAGADRILVAVDSAAQFVLAWVVQSFMRATFSEEGCIEEEWEEELELHLLSVAEENVAAEHTDVAHSTSLLKNASKIALMSGVRRLSRLWSPFGRLDYRLRAVQPD
jgi:hypothetical protein